MCTFLFEKYFLLIQVNMQLVYVPTEYLLFYLEGGTRIRTRVFRLPDYCSKNHWGYPGFTFTDTSRSLLIWYVKMVSDLIACNFLLTSEPGQYSSCRPQLTDSNILSAETIIYEDILNWTLRIIRIITVRTVQISISQQQFLMQYLFNLNLHNFFSLTTECTVVAVVIVFSVIDTRLNSEGPTNGLSNRQVCARER